MLDTMESTEQATGGRKALVGIAVLLVLMLGGMGYLGYLVLDRLEGIETRVSELNEQAQTASDRSERALERALKAETAAQVAADGRRIAEEESRFAQEQAADAEQDADAARAAAMEARAEAERIRQEAEAEMERLEEALSQVADTRRTALGLVMNLGSDHLQFDFDKAELRAENRELLSRIAGILMTSNDYTVSVHGHTDDVGSDAYNQTLSERRAQAVCDYLVEAGLPQSIFTVKGFGKSQPLVPDTSDEARQRNRRVELGIVNTRIRFRGRVPEAKN